MKTIAWDVDDTLNDFMRLWLDKWFLPRNKKNHTAYADLKRNPPHQILGISLGEYLRSYDAFRLSGVYSFMRPDKDVLNWFKRNGAKYRHIAVTAVPLKAAHESASWVYRHFGRWIRSFHIVPSPRAGERLLRYDKNKADLLRSVGGCDFFVDDSPENIRQVKLTGSRCLTVPRPWNAGKGDMAGLLARIS